MAEKSQMKPQVYTLEEVAGILACSVGTIRKLGNNGTLHMIDISEGMGRPTYRITIESVNEYLKGIAQSEW